MTSSPFPELLWQIPFGSAVNPDWRILRFAWEVATPEELALAREICESFSDATVSNSGTSYMLRLRQFDRLPRLRKLRHRFLPVELDLWQPTSCTPLMEPGYFEDEHGECVMEYLVPTQALALADTSKWKREHSNIIYRFLQIEMAISEVVSKWSDLSVSWSTISPQRFGQLPNVALILGVFSLLRQIQCPQESQQNSRSPKGEPKDQLLRRCVEVFEEHVPDTSMLASLKTFEARVYAEIEADPGKLIGRPTGVPLHRLLNDLYYGAGILHGSARDAKALRTAFMRLDPKTVVTAILLGVVQVSHELHEAAALIDANFERWKQRKLIPEPSVVGLHDLFHGKI